MDGLTDTDLAQKIRDSNELAFKEIYDRYHVQMYYIAKKYVKRNELAEDAVQDTFIKLWRKRESIDETKSIKGFLFTMLRNYLLNQLRDRKKEIVSITDVNRNLLQSRVMTDDDILYKEYHSILERGLTELTDRKREVFELRTKKGHTNSEVAELLKIDIKTVKTHFYLSSKFIRAYLKKHAGLMGVLIFFGVVF
jgi:RNA polymerase sigma-70 factor (ECF subfamily)